MSEFLRECLLFNRQFYTAVCMRIFAYVYYKFAAFNRKFSISAVKTQIFIGQSKVYFFALTLVQKYFFAPFNSLIGLVIDDLQSRI